MERSGRGLKYMTAVQPKVHRLHDVGEITDKRGVSRISAAARVNTQRVRAVVRNHHGGAVERPGEFLFQPSAVSLMILQRIPCTKRPSLSRDPPVICDSKFRVLRLLALTQGRT